MGVPGGGRNEITDRFLRHMQIIGIDAFDDNTLHKIFSTIIEWQFGKGYVEVVQRMAKVSKQMISFCIDKKRKTYY